MRTQIFFAAVFAIGSTFTIGACDAPDPVDSEHVGGVVLDSTEISDEVTFRDVVENGVELNGINFNGINFNGINFNGINFNGINFNGINFNGINFNGINFNTASLGGGLSFSATPALGARFKVVKSKLEFTDDDNNVVRGNSLAGTEFDMTISGVLKHLRVNSVFADANDPDISYTNLSIRQWDGSWETFCRDGAGNPTEAIVIEGRYDNDGNFLADTGTMAFACRGTASAKCIVWGYKPWESVNGVSLRNHYQACLAMVRGDYCRNNIPHTTNGTAIDVSDNPSALGGAPQIQVSGTNWQVEAQWGPTGAVCFSTPRKLIYPRDAINPCFGVVPTCPANKNTWVAGALLMTQATPG
jgi:hypothetical protein